MADLKTEYTDIKNIRHNVEHLTIFAGDVNDKQRITEELCRILKKAKTL